MRVSLSILCVVMAFGCSSRMERSDAVGSSALAEKSDLSEFLLSPRGETDEAVRLLTTAKPGVYLQADTMLWVEDRSFVANLLVDLRRAKPVRVKAFNLVLDRPLIFFNQSNEVVAAYTYYPGGVPEYAFRRGELQIQNGVVLVYPTSVARPNEPNGVSLPDFDLRTGKHFQLLP